jgi:hypothetical protein
MVDRWDVNNCCDMEIISDGDFVSYTDYAALQESHARLLEACIALQMEAAARCCGLRIADEAIAAAQPFAEK